MAINTRSQNQRAPVWVRRTHALAVSISCCAAGCAQTDLDVIRVTAPALNPTGQASESAPAATTPSAPSPAGPPSSTLGSVSTVNTATSIDTVAPSASPPPMTEAGVPVDPCRAATVNRDGIYRIHLPASQGCLQATLTIVPPITGSQHGNALRLSTPCADDASTLFRLTAPTLQGGFQITSELLSTPDTPTVLDVLMGETVDGTRVILYPSNGFANQWFSFVEREPGLYSVSPTRALDLCLTLDVPAIDGPLLVETCLSSNAFQEWQVLPEGCDPSTN